MMHCSDKARALCAQRRCCGVTERGEFTTDSWCAGFNAGVAKALQSAIDLEPLISGVKSLAEILPELIKSLPEILPELIKSLAETLPELMRSPEFRAALEAAKEGSDGRT